MSANQMKISHDKKGGSSKVHPVYIRMEKNLKYTSLNGKEDV